MHCKNGIVIRCVESGSRRSGSTETCLSLSLSEGNSCAALEETMVIYFPSER